MSFVELRASGLAHRLVLLALAAGIVVGGLSAHRMDEAGHIVTGMSNQIVWGTPHVFAVFLILVASGALNVASVASVFGREAYRPLARLSGLVSVAALAGGLAILVLDLGRPDRLIVAMTHYNFRSIFAWNIFLYTGFMALVAVYLWMHMERRFNRHVKAAGTAAFVWRIVLTTGTGSIFGFLVAREAYDAAVMAPLFVAASLAAGQAGFVLVAMGLEAVAPAAAPRAGLLPDALLRRMKSLLGIFVAAQAYLVVVFHLTNAYAAEHGGFVRFVLLDGGPYTTVFWLGQVLIGTAVPLLICLTPGRRLSRAWVAAAAAATALGVLSMLYVVIVAGQAYPLAIFPGYEILESSFFDASPAAYTPSGPELGLGLGGVALALALVALGLRVLPFLPADAEGPAGPPP